MSKLTLSIDKSMAKLRKASGAVADKEGQALQIIAAIAGHDADIFREQVLDGIDEAVCEMFHIKVDEWVRDVYGIDLNAEQLDTICESVPLESVGFLWGHSDSTNGKQANKAASRKLPKLKAREVW